MHLILSHAASHRWPDAPLGTLALPQLQRLLARMRRVQTLDDREWERPHPLMPHERAQALALGWPDAGPWPQAARDTGTAGAQAWITPCHWQVGMDQVVMLAPQALALDDAESQQLLQAMQPYMAEDGLQVQWHSALRWLARGDVLADVACASLARVSGMNVRPWVTDGSLPAALRRLQSEMQMLLYNHPVNDARAARGLPIVNSFWLHGAGPAPATATANATEADVRCIDTLQTPAQQQDWAAWQSTWQTLDRDLLGPLAATDTPLTLTLCSETSAHTWQSAPLPWHERLQRRLRPLAAGAALQALLRPGTPPHTDS
jgi:hypothetical protein